MIKYLWLLLVPSVVCAQQVVGEARDSKTGALLYTEQYQITRSQQGEVQQVEVQYQSPASVTFASKTLTYRGSELQPAILFYDIRNDLQIESDVKEGVVHIRETSAGNSKQSQLKLDKSLPTAIDAGFVALVQQNWQSLLSGTPLKFEFIPIDKQKSVGFELSLQHRDEQQVQLKMAPTSFWVSQAIDPVILTFDLQQRLIEYQGITNIQQEKQGRLTGKNYVADIHYRYVESN